MTNKTILIIDDSFINIEILTEFLHEKYNIISETNPNNAVDIVKNNHIDLILLDIVMPQMDGYELCKILKKIDKIKDIPIIFSTANTDEDSIEKAFEAGGVDFINKPFKLKEILARVNTHLLLDENKNRLENLICNINSSINYASRIQNSLLTPKSIIDTMVGESFIIWEPLDKISGDLYVYEECDNFILFGVVDCTGHGIPGAIMSMLVSTLIKKLKSEINYDNPELILQQLNKDIKEYLKQNSSSSESDDGLDAGFCVIDKNKTLIKYAGARINLIYIEDSKTHKIKADKQSVGYKRSSIDYKYKSHRIKLKENQTFYLFTDGIIDQIGEEIPYPFGTKRLIKLLETIYKIPLKMQKDIILDELKDYQGNSNRRDDITMIGFRV
jgi:CheY-like chemotaxis protein/serine/threonine protein phosphatase PrpC